MFTCHILGLSFAARILFVAGKNQLYYGDNLVVLREHIRDDSVDLIYLDPPFNSRQDYNVLFAERDGTRSASQIIAFEDPRLQRNSTLSPRESLSLRLTSFGSVSRPLLPNLAQYRGVFTLGVSASISFGCSAARKLARAARDRGADR
jgi:hypothetical protein